MTHTDTGSWQWWIAVARKYKTGTEKRLPQGEASSKQVAQDRAGGVLQSMPPLAEQRKRWGQKFTEGRPGAEEIRIKILRYASAQAKNGLSFERIMVSGPVQAWIRELQSLGWDAAWIGRHVYQDVKYSIEGQKKV